MSRVRPSMIACTSTSTVRRPASVSRVSFTFSLEGFGPVETIAWTLWRRTDECQIPRDVGEPVVLAAGFGVLFEAISLDARQAIAALVHRVAPKN